MSDSDKKPPSPQPARPSKGDGSKAGGKVAKPSWADGLRKLYDDVVAEPLPDSFDDLLKKLDQGGNG